MLSFNIGNYLIKHQSEKYIIIVFNSISILVSHGKKLQILYLLLV